MLRKARETFGTLTPPPEAEREIPAQAPWLAEAAGLAAGNPEPPGMWNGRRRLRLVEALDHATPLKPAWCGIFADHCLSSALPDHEPPWCFPRARPWRRWGRPSAPRRGAILVFWLVARWSPFGHVGFLWDEDETDFHVLGGNQRDRIGLDRFPKSRLLDCRWPETGVETGARSGG